MRATLGFWLSTLAALAGLPSSAQAEVVVQVPFVTVQSGSSGVYVRAPFVRVLVPGTVPAPVAPPIVESAPPPEPIGEPIPIPLPRQGQPDFTVPVPLPRPVPVRPPTPREFAESFRPAPGTYDVVLLHPVTNQPVKVTFTLPEGQARQVRTYPRQINFDYGSRRDVSIRFLADGRVRVTN